VKKNSLRYVSRRNVVNLARQKWTLDAIDCTVVGRTMLTVLATIDGQFITLMVHLGQQYDACDAARRAGPSATAYTGLKRALRTVSILTL